MAILEAYFDDSERKDGMFCVAGYVFAPPQAKKFGKEWRQLHHPLLPCHMTDLATGGGIYKNMPNSERNGLVVRSVAIINDRVTCGFVVSCDRREFESVAPAWVRSIRSPYAVCAHLAMQRVGMWLGDENRMDRVAYFFEAGSQTQGEADELIRLARTDPTDPYRYHCHVFVPKSDSVALQAADLLAWEWTKFMDETVTKGNRPSRGSFRALMHKYPERYKGMHFTGAALRDYMKVVTDSLHQEGHQ